MLVIIKSAPDTAEGKRGVKLASDMAADIVFIQNGAYFCRRDGFEGFRGTVYVLDEDKKLRGIADVPEGAKTIGYDELVDVMAGDKVVGMF
jgi:sulfur transfer complex TusBCD TusB component (DsrH family)